MIARKGASVVRWVAAAGCLLLVLAGCGGAEPPASGARPPGDAASVPSATPSTTPMPSPNWTELPRTSVTPAPPARFRYRTAQLEAALPSIYGKAKLEKFGAIFPPLATARSAVDPLPPGQVSPELCRKFIQFDGTPGIKGDFVAPGTPSALTDGGAPMGPFLTGPQVFASVVELPGALGDRLLDQRLPTPAECAHIQLDGHDRASMVERPVPGFGVRARYVVTSYRVADVRSVERKLYYRTPTYVVEVRMTGNAATDATFLAFARVTRDRLAAALKG
jgi:hypothetical protein